MRDLREWRNTFHQETTLLCNTSKAITRATMSHPCRIAAKTFGTAFYKPNNIRNMKEEILEAIYGTVERLEQKVDELSASPKNAGAETVLSPASVDTSKLEKAILSVLYKNSVETQFVPRNFP